MSRDREWYHDWFGEDYLALYPHRDEREARAGIDLVLGTCGTPDGMVLDLASGAGRHMLELERRGIRTVGLDLSATLLREARAAGGRLHLVRGDMRHLPFSDGAFSMVVNFFTSFGYFDAQEDDANVLGEIRRVLATGGCFALDFLNADRVRASLVPRDERRLGDRRIVQRRWLEEDGAVVVKEIIIFQSDSSRPQNTYRERVRLYAPAELERMLQNAGLAPEHGYGDYTGVEPCAECPRHIVIGHAV